MKAGAQNHRGCQRSRKAESQFFIPVQISTEKILVADSSKFGKRSLSRIVPLSAIDKIITDDALTAETQAELLVRGIELVLV